MPILVRGGPRALGKTTLGTHFLAAGVLAGEKNTVNYLERTRGANPCQRQNTFGLDLKDVEVLDLSPDAKFFTEAQSYDIFSASEVEREPISKAIMETVESLQPGRIFIDSMTQFRYLTTDLFQFRKQVLSLTRFLLDQGATVFVYVRT